MAILLLLWNQHVIQGVQKTLARLWRVPIQYLQKRGILFYTWRQKYWSTVYTWWYGISRHSSSFTGMESVPPSISQIGYSRCTTDKKIVQFAKSQPAYISQYYKNIKGNLPDIKIYNLMKTSPKNNNGNRRRDNQIQRFTRLCTNQHWWHDSSILLWTTRWSRSPVLLIWSMRISRSYLHHLPDCQTPQRKHRWLRCHHK